MNKVTPTRQKALGAMEAIMAFSLGGSSVVAAKLLTSSVPLFTTCFFSMATGLLLMVPLQIVKRKEFLSLTKRDILMIALQGISGMLLFRIFTLAGLRFTTAADAGIVTSLGPAVMTILSILFLRERPESSKIIAAILSVLGLFVITVRNAGSEAFTGSLLGNSLIFAAVCCEAGMVFFRKYHKRKISAITNTTVLILCSMLLALPGMIAELQTYEIGQIDFQGWIILFYYGLFPSAIGYLLMADGVVRIPGSLAGIAMAAAPVAVLGLSVVLLGENLHWTHLIGLLFITAAILLGNKIIKVRTDVE